MSEAALEDSLRLHLTDIALANLARSKTYQTDSVVSSYLADHYGEFETLTSNVVGRSRAEPISDLFAKLNITLPRLRPLSDTIRRSFIERDLYEIGLENLEIATASNAKLSLDNIRDHEPAVYKYVLDNLEHYIGAVDGVFPTIESAKHFISVIEEVLKQEPGRLGDVIARASTACVVADLTEVSTDAWPLLAEYERFLPTFKNVSGYTNTVGALDNRLAKVLASAGRITETGGADGDAKVELAKTILSAGDCLSPAELRVKLVASLGLDRHLGMGEINADIGNLFALLLRHDLIADEAETYVELANTDWASREAFIHESQAFINYLHSCFAASDLSDLLESNKIDRTIKVEIAGNAQDYVDGAGISGSTKLALFARQEQIRLKPDVIEKLARDEVEASLVIDLLEPHFASLERGKLFAILKLMGGDYQKLTSIGRKGVKIPNTTADRALLETLKGHGIVTSYDDKGTKFKVHRKRV